MPEPCLLGSKEITEYGSRKFLSVSRFFAMLHLNDTFLSNTGFQWHYNFCSTTWQAKQEDVSMFRYKTTSKNFTRLTWSPRFCDERDCLGVIKNKTIVFWQNFCFSKILEMLSIVGYYESTPMHFSWNKRCISSFQLRQLSYIVFRWTHWSTRMQRIFFAWETSWPRNLKRTAYLNSLFFWGTIQNRNIRNIKHDTDVATSQTLPRFS